LAIEAKWLEPRYAAVANWLAKSQSPSPSNREEVLRGWLDLIELRIGQPLSTEKFSDAVYQMVHRAASACYEAKSPGLAYMQFLPVPEHRSIGEKCGPDVIRQDLKNLHDMFGKPPTFPFYLVGISLQVLPAFQEIQHLPKGSVETAKVVRAALSSSSLFEFGEPCISPM
jgi:hypothetical protein